MGRIAGLTAEATRRRVVEAAAAVFAEAGYEGARVSEIARRAGLSTGAIYNHYASKADLLGAVVHRHAARELRGLLLGTPGEDDVGGVLDLIARNGAALQHRPTEVSVLAEAILAARRDPELGRSFAHRAAERERLLADVIRFAQASGEAVADVDPDVVARFCLMLGLGSLLVSALDLPPTDEGLWSEFIDRLIDGFRIKETG